MCHDVCFEMGGSNNQEMRPVENVKGDKEDRYQELTVQFQTLAVNLQKTIY